MPAFRNEFTWSWSRHRCFERCPREYWLHYYGSWGGWAADAEPDVREAYIQKKLCSRPAWIGILIHEAVEWVLKQQIAGYGPNPAIVVERFLRKATQQIDDSKRGMYRFRPSKVLGFVEHYYEQQPDETWDESLAEIRRQLSELKNNRVLTRTVDVIGQVREVEELKQIPIEGVNAWVSIDALVGDGKGGLSIIDWKTGKHHTDEKVSAQLGVYALYVLQTYFQNEPEEVALERIRMIFANLRTSEHKVWQLQLDDLEQTRRLIRSSSEAMRSKLTSIEENSAEKHNFPMLEEGSAACSLCRFRKSCGR